MNMRVEAVGLHEHLTGGQELSNNEAKKQHDQAKRSGDTDLQKLLSQAKRFPAQQRIKQSEEMLSSSGGSKKLLKQLFSEMNKAVSPETLSNIKEILDENELSSLPAKATDKDTLSVIQKWKAHSESSRPESDEIKDVVASQEQKAQIADTATKNIRRELLKERAETNYSQSLLKSARGAAQETAENSNAKLSVHTSYAELWARIAKAIQGVKSDYVDFYADLMQKYTEMYEEFNKHVQKGSSESVSSGEDGNKVFFSGNKMREAYRKFANALEKIDLGFVKNWSGMTPEQRESMVTTLLPAFNIIGDGKIVFNMDQYNTVHETYPDGAMDNAVSTASYQAWLATFNSAGTALQSNMQAFAQRYSQANSTFDNLNKVLSAAISSLADSAKDVLKSLN